MSDNITTAVDNDDNDFTPEQAANGIYEAANILTELIGEEAVDELFVEAVATYGDWGLDLDNADQMAGVLVTTQSTLLGAKTVRELTAQSIPLSLVVGVQVFALPAAVAVLDGADEVRSTVAHIQGEEESA